MNLPEIEQLTRKYADARQSLANVVNVLQDEIEYAKRKSLARIKELVARAAEREAGLKAGIEASPELFVRPRTMIFHGVKIGFRKGSGGINWEEDESVVARIKKLFSEDEAELLIKTTEKPIAKALSDLDVDTLKKLGCTVEATGDEVFVKAVDSEVDKVVSALLKDAAEVQAAEKN